MDKYVIEHKVRDSRGMPLYSGVAAAVFGTIVWLIAGHTVPGSYDWLLLLVSGCLTMFGFALYFRALAGSHTSYIVALLQTTPLFTVLMAGVFVGERLNWLQITGFVLVLTAVVGLSLRAEQGRLHFDRNFWIILAGNVIFAAAAIVVKFASVQTSFGTLLAFESWGIAGGGVLLSCLPDVRRAFWNSFRTVGRRTLGIMLLNEVLFITSKTMTFYAISLGPVALVSVLSGTQVFYGLLFGAALSFFWPRLFHEELAGRQLIHKTGWTLLLFAGIVCIVAV